MFYTIYKITNTINGKYYIGKHQTKDLDDGYMGSGKILRYAIRKHGIENFKKEILHVFDTEQEMNDKEKELVVISEETYNLCDGGHGGFGYINKYTDKETRITWAKTGRSAANKKISQTKSKKSIEEYYKNVKKCDNCKQELPYKKRQNKFCGHSCSAMLNNKGRKHSFETKEKIRKSIEKLSCGRLP